MVIKLKNPGILPKTVVDKKLAKNNFVLSPRKLT